MIFFSHLTGIALVCDVMRIKSLFVINRFCTTCYIIHTFIIRVFSYIMIKFDITVKSSEKSNATQTLISLIVILLVNIINMRNYRGIYKSYSPINTIGNIVFPRVQDKINHTRCRWKCWGFWRVTQTVNFPPHVHLYTRPNKTFSHDTTKWQFL